MRIRRIWIATLLATTLALAGCASTQDGSQPYGGGNGGGADGGDGGMGQGETVVAANVSMTGSEYEPMQVQVSPGDTVRWTNEDPYEHTVTIREENTSQKLKDTNVPSGESTTFTFEEAGTYQVWCRYHGQPGSGMHMTVQVG